MERYGVARRRPRDVVRREGQTRLANIDIKVGCMDLQKSAEDNNESLEHDGLLEELGWGQVTDRTVFKIA